MLICITKSWIISHTLKITTLDRTSTTPVVLSHLNFGMTKNMHSFFFMYLKGFHVPWSGIYKLPISFSQDQEKQE